MTCLKDVMTRNVESISKDETIETAARRMAELDVGFLPVIDGEGLCGVVTDRDITIRAIAKGLDPQRTHVEDVMSPQVELLPEDFDVGDAVRVMEDRQIRRLVVCGDHERVVGVVSLGDLAVATHNHELSGEALERISEPAAPRR